MDACEKGDDKVAQSQEWVWCVQGKSRRPTWLGHRSRMGEGREKICKVLLAGFECQAEGTGLDLLGTGGPGKVSSPEKGEGYLLGY